MTRINVGYNPRKLNTKMLLAEHREIKRIPNAVNSGRAVFNNIPEKFCLGKGHVKFFYNKLGYLLNRYISIYNECLRRGYKVTCYAGAWNGIGMDLMNDYKPTKADRMLIEQRISERLK